MAAPPYPSPRYRVVTFDGGREYRVDDTFESEAEALDLIHATTLLHRLTGWEVGECSCGWGRYYIKRGVERGVHVELVWPEEDASLEVLALALGVLAPVNDNGLVAV
jgi:hypothetical protein